MSIGVNWGEVWAPVWKSVWVSTLVEVPDVLGQTQADGTAAIEAAGLAVAVETAYSSTVAVGAIISQSPAGGAQVSAGATVTITVSLGDRGETFAGGFWHAFDLEQARRRKRRREQEEAEEEAERIEEATTREIARLLRQQEAIEERHAELKRLARLVGVYADRQAEIAVSDRVAKALARVAARESNWALAALDRELRRAQEEEAFFMEAALLILHG